MATLATAMAMFPLAAPAATGDPVLINEVLASHTGTDDTEFVELFGIPGTSLDGISFIAVESDDLASNGAIDQQLDFGPADVIGDNGYYLVGNPVGLLAEYGVTPNVDIADNFFENSSATYALVETASISGGTVSGSEVVLDAIALTDGGAGDTFFFGAPVFGPDGSFFPAGVSRAVDGVDTDTLGDWVLGDFNLGAGNTPTAGTYAVSLEITELHYDNDGGDVGEAVEVSGPAGADVTGWSIVLYNGSSTQRNVYDTILLNGVIPAGGAFTVYPSSIQNGAPDGLALVSPDGTVVEFLSYEGVFTAANGPAEGQTSVDIGVSESGSTPVGYSLQKIGGVWNEPAPNTFAPELETPGPVCVADGLTLISSIQGSGEASPLVGETVIIGGSITGIFDGLSGFYVQEEPEDSDGDPATSEGVFVFGDAPDGAVIGDIVQVEGTVSEYVTSGGASSLTEISSATSVLCDEAQVTVEATDVTFPVSAVSDLEAYEGMLVELPETMVIAEYFNFDRFGEVVVSSERYLQPTALYEPGPAAVAAAENYLLNRITIDDGRSNQNPNPAIHPGNGQVFDLDNLFRGGDTITGITGVIDDTFGLYRLQPTEYGTYESVNERPEAPDEVGGSLEVASFNVLNYFTTLDTGPDICGPNGDLDCRGANDATEFTRQRDKIIAALSVMDSDVVGLIEIENHPGDVPTADLVSGLNEELGAGTYDYIETGAIGTDAIRVAVIYKPGTVSPVGDFAVLDNSVDSRFDDTKNRPVLAQTFMDSTTGGLFTVAVNHLKSKGSPCDDVGDPDLGEGAGNCNVTRTMAAEAMVDWLADDPTGSGDSDSLIIGDLNSYDKEDPIDVLLAGGFTDLLRVLSGEDAYSYVFDGQIGYLDHALANAGLADEVTGVTVWHINADEADLIDYDTSFKQAAQAAIYAPDAYRSSDHDPVIIGLDVCDEIAPTIEVAVTPSLLWPANHKYVEVEAAVVVSDNFDPNPTVELISVVSSEPDNGADDGNTVNDIVIVDDSTFKLRAERSGLGEGRTYTITYRVTDACGNTAEQAATVFVPLSRGGR
jgi:predicted extracellular nuclease